MHTAGDKSLPAPTLRANGVPTAPLPRTSFLRHNDYMDRVNTDASPPRLSSVLTETDVLQFQKLMLQECGNALASTEAWSRATELLNFFRMLLGPMPDDPQHGDA